MILKKIFKTNSLCTGLALTVLNLYFKKVLSTQVLMNIFTDRDLKRLRRLPNAINVNVNVLSPPQAYMQPHLLGSEFTHLEFPRTVCKKEVGKRMLYRDYSMKGW